MRYRILGPVQTEPTTPSAAKPRAVLAALLVRSNHVVSADTLIDELWPEDPPRTASATLHVYVSHLRKTLGGAGRGPLSTQAPGYRLKVAEHELDLLLFKADHDQGRTAYRQRNFARASRSLHAALDLWTGPPLAGVPHGWMLRAASGSLDLLRMEVQELRIAADLWLDRHGDLSGELMTLVHEHPLREMLHAHLMVALYRQGRQSEALRVFGRLRDALIEELGTEPSAVLQDLHRRILRLEQVTHVDEFLHQDEPAWLRSPATPPVVRLPRPVADFLGRDEALALADRTLRGEYGQPPAQVLTVVGAVGVGKTEFAVQVAHRAAELFPDGRVLVNLRGADGRPVDAGEALARLLRKLNAGRHEAPGNTPVAVEELSDLLETRLSGRRRMLLILDDAVTERQIRPILDAAPEATVLVTGRRVLAGVEGARHVTLDVLHADDAHALLRRIGGPRMAADPAATAEIAQLCGNLPYALRLAGATLASHPHWSARTLAAQLADERARLDVLSAGDRDVRSSLLAGYAEVDAVAQRAFRLLSTATTTDVALWTAAALLDLPPAHAARILTTLVRAHLVRGWQTEDGTVRYGLTGLLRSMSLELLAVEPVNVVRDAIRRMCQAYLRLARHADQRLAPVRGPATEESTCADARAIVGASPLAWFQQESPGLVAAVRRAHTAGLWELTWQLSDSLAGYFHACAAWDDWEQTSGLALHAAREAENAEAEASALYAQGQLAWQRRQLARAEERFGLAHQRAVAAGDRRTLARSVIGLADVALDQGLAAEAWQMYGQALAICRAEDDLGGVTDALRGLALADVHRGRYESALYRFTECHEVAAHLGDRRWSEFARRAANHIRLATVRGAAAIVGPFEVRPGMWAMEGVAG
jgi:DNA-binding SARP family transcriptional activator